MINNNKKNKYFPTHKFIYLQNKSKMTIRYTSAEKITKHRI